MQIKILAEGGAMKPGPVLSQKLGPAGLNVGQVIQKINDATKDFKGLKVPVEIDVNTKTRTFEVKVFSPPTSELIKKELGVEKGSGVHKKMKVGNASIEQIILIAKTKMPNLLCRDLKSAVKTIAGTCVSLGVLIENKPAVEVVREIEEGKYDKEISQVKTETSSEKKKELTVYFTQLKAEQDRALKQEQAAKEAAAAESAAAAAPTTTTTATAKTPAKEEKPKKK